MNDSMVNIVLFGYDGSAIVAWPNTRSLPYLRQGRLRLRSRNPIL
jgi:hypothetical protein